ncbi:stage II sporulation protein M [Cohnella yongneupensis]|uniref:Stage II sporulation protein M n=1 Tax=Cohnella yongneupensis TaxID=425006 RepID=A0ABW0QWX2_9BACL
MFSRQGLLQTWNDVRGYFIFACILFFASMFVGGSSDAPVDWMNGQLREIQKLRESIEGTDNPERAMFFLILGKNLLASLMAMGFGIVGAIMPIAVLVSNGMLIGYFISLVAHSDKNVWGVVAKGLLPHGIIELCAIFLACAFGVRFGITFIRGIWRSLTGKSEPWQPFARTASGAIPGIAAIVILLTVAAIVESTITYWLASS